MLATEKNIEVRHGLLARLARARACTDDLFNLVRPDSFYERPIPERHRIIFYLGHLEAFDLNLLKSGIPGPDSSRPEFDRLFAFGIDPVEGGLPSDNPGDWPSIQNVRRYVSEVRSALDAGLAAVTRSDAAFHEHDEEFPLPVLLNVAIEHRLMHAETLTYILHQLPVEKKICRESATQSGSAPVAPGMVEVPAGSATLGLARGSHEPFGWDNEFEAHTVTVPTFAMDQYKVTNGQFLEFLAAGGYQDATLWLASDWNWKTEHNIAHPVFWKPAGGQWLFRTMFEEIPLPLDWPVYVSHAEASAYARWAGKTLPTEPQWHRAAYGTPEGAEQPFPWGKKPPSPRHGNFDFRSWHPSAVHAFPEGRSSFGVLGMLGNGWEWTSSVFQPFPAFKPFPFYRGYSADFFDGKHFVLKGGSARTAACLLRRSFRSWFQPHYQYVYAGFRCVKN